MMTRFLLRRIAAIRLYVMLPEEALRASGDFGPFQYLLIIYLCVLVAPVRVMPLFAHVFSLLVPPHHCRLPQQLYGQLLGNASYARDLILQAALPREDDGSFSRCRMYHPNDTIARYEKSALLRRSENNYWNGTTGGDADSQTMNCIYGWEYDYSLIYPTVVSEYDWVCENHWKAYVADTTFWMCSIVGVLICGYLTDKVGRVPVIAAVNLLCGVAGLYTFFTTGFAHFLVSRVCLGLVMLTLSITPFVLVVEFVAPKLRMMVLTGFQLSYPIVGAAFPWLAVLLFNWRTLTVASAAVPLFAMVCCLFLPESIRWLVSHGKQDRAKKIVLMVAKVNGKVLSEEFLQKFQFSDLQQTDKSKHSVMDMLKTSNLRKNFILTLACWTLACLVYTAGQLYAANASQDPFVMTTAVNLVDVVSTVTALPLADRWGRRPVMMTACIGAALGYFCAVAVPWDAVLCATAVSMVARLALTMAYDVAYLHAAEVYPTVVRSQAMAIRQAFGSVGRFLSSQVMQLTYFGRSLPLVVMGTMSFLLAMLTFPLPETLNQELPEELADGEKLVLGQNTCCFSASAKPIASPASPRPRSRTHSVL
nr:organic cation/carnitine transporter 2-like [Dermacentor andersoni]